MSDKHDNFVRLSEKRLETIEDAIRVFSNLSGPSYEWTMDEVRRGFNRISEASGKALERFSESRLWEKAARDEGIERREQAIQATQEPVQDDEPLTSTEAAAAWEIEQKAAPAAAIDTITPRQREMLRIWDEVESDDGALLEVLAMQREVIANLQATIDKARSKADA